MTKKFIQRQSVRKVSRSSLVRSPRTAVAESSSGRSSSSSSLPMSLVVEKSANLVYQSDLEIGSTTPRDEAMKMIMTMVMEY